MSVDMFQTQLRNNTLSHAVALQLTLKLNLLYFTQKWNLRNTATDEGKQS